MLLFWIYAFLDLALALFGIVFIHDFGLGLVLFVLGLGHGIFDCCECIVRLQIHATITMQKQNTKKVPKDDVKLT